MGRNMAQVQLSLREKRHSHPRQIAIRAGGHI